MSDAVAALTYDAVTESELGRRLDVPRVALYDTVESTMDVAHELAERGAPAGSLVLANTQRAGRGRGGRRWLSAPGSGIWMTLVERPNDPQALEVLSLRVGIRAARALDRFAPAPIGLKWPNDLYLLGGKLGGILVETRWREGRPDWVAIGLGLNVVAPPDVPGAADRGIGAFFEGDKGTLICDYNTRELTINGEKMGDIASVPITNPRSPGHQQNFIDCVKLRGQPVADLETALASSALCHLGNLAYRLGRSVNVDPVTGLPRHDPNALLLAQCEYRSPWKLPELTVG